MINRALDMMNYESIRAFKGYDGRQVWFQGIAISGPGNVSLCLGDGSAIPPEAAEAFRAIVEEESGGIQGHSCKWRSN